MDRWDSGYVIERELQAERAVIPGRGHSVQRVGQQFNDRLAAFIDEAERRTVGVPQ